MRKICTGLRKKGGTKYAVCYMCKIMCTNNTKCKLVPCVAALQPLVCVSVCMCVWMGEIETVKHFVELVKVKKKHYVFLWRSSFVCVFGLDHLPWMFVCVCCCAGCMRDVRLNGHSLPLDGQSSEFVTVLERRGVQAGCHSDACRAKPCLKPLYCVDLWRKHECRWDYSVHHETND